MKDKAFLHRMQLLGKVGNWTDMGPGHVRGYPGLVHTAKLIAEYIPECGTFVEVFAGLGRVSPHVRAKTKVLNDMSDYAYNHNKKFPYTITKEQFLDCANRWDGPNVIEFYDPPWDKTEYQEGCRNRAFCDRTPKDYYDAIFELIPTLKCDWFVCGRKDNTRLKDPKYHHKLFESKVKIMGGNIKTLVMSNKPFTRYHQSQLFGEQDR